jgi:hypothetical protein
MFSKTKGRSKATPAPTSPEPKVELIVTEAPAAPAVAPPRKKDPLDCPADGCALGINHAGPHRDL